MNKKIALIFAVLILLTISLLTNAYLAISLKNKEDMLRIKEELIIQKDYNIISLTELYENLRDESATNTAKLNSEDIDLCWEKLDKLQTFVQTNCKNAPRIGL